MFLPPLVIVDAGLHPLLAVVYRPAFGVAEQGVEDVARHFPARHHVEIAVVGLHIGEPLEPFGFLQPTGLFALDFAHDCRRLIRVRIGWRDFLGHLAHTLGDQFVTQARCDSRPAVLAYPRKERPAVDVLAVAMVATVRAIQRLVAAFDVAVAVFGMVRADNAAPAFVVRLGQDHVVVGQPLQDAVAACVTDVDALIVGGAGFGWRDVQRLADTFQRVLSVWMELDQLGFEIVAALLQVDAAGDTAVAHRIGRAGVGIARLGYGGDSGGKVVFGRLLIEDVAPLERAFARLHDPRRLQWRGLRLRADVVQHHEQDVLAVVALGAGLAVLEAVNDERAGVDVPCLPFLDLGRPRHERRERRLGDAVAMIDQLAIGAHRLLVQQQRCLAIDVDKPCHEFDECIACLTHGSFLLTCHNGSWWRLPRSTASPWPTLASSS